MAKEKYTKAEEKNAELLGLMEVLIDEHGVRACLDAMSNLCVAKAEHIGRNYGYDANKNLIGAWSEARDAITEALTKVYVS